MSSKLIQFLKRYLKLNKKFIKFNNLFNNLKKKDPFVIFIDLNSFAPNFNYVEYLLYGKYISKNKNLYVVVLPKDDFVDVSTKEKKNFFLSFREKTILKPLIEMIIGKDATIIFAKNRNDVKEFFEINSKNKLPRNANFNDINFTAIWVKDLYQLMLKDKSPLKISKNQNNISALKNLFLKDLNSKKIITISVKYNSYKKFASSKIEEWRKLGKWLESKNYNVIYVSDIENFEILSELNKQEFLTVSIICSYDLEMRNSLYDLAYFNFSVNGGAAQILIHSNNNYIISRFNNSNNSLTESTENIKNAYGIDKNENLPFSTNTQKILWDDNSENFDYLKVYFEKLEKKLS